MRTFSIIFLFTICFNQSVYAGEVIAFSLVSLDQATKKVIQQSRSKVLGAKTEQIEGREVHIIKILTEDGRIQYIRVDAETGKLF